MAEGNVTEEEILLRLESKAEEAIAQLEAVERRLASFDDTAAGLSEQLGGVSQSFNRMADSAERGTSKLDTMFKLVVGFTASVHLMGKAFDAVKSAMQGVEEATLGAGRRFGEFTREYDRYSKQVDASIKSVGNGLDQFKDKAIQAAHAQVILSNGMVSYNDALAQNRMMMRDVPNDLMRYGREMASITQRIDAATIAQQRYNDAVQAGVYRNVARRAASRAESDLLDAQAAFSFRDPTRLTNLGFRVNRADSVGAGIASGATYGGLGGFASGAASGALLGGRFGHLGAAVGGIGGGLMGGAAGLVGGAGIGGYAGLDPVSQGRLGTIGGVALSSGLSGAAVGAVRGVINAPITRALALSSTYTAAGGGLRGAAALGRAGYGAVQAHGIRGVVSSLGSLVGAGATGAGILASGGGILSVAKAGLMGLGRAVASTTATWGLWGAAIGGVIAAFQVLEERSLDLEDHKRRVQELTEEYESLGVNMKKVKEEEDKRKSDDEGMFIMMGMAGQSHQVIQPGSKEAHALSEQRMSMDAIMQLDPNGSTMIPGIDRLVDPRGQADISKRMQRASLIEDVEARELEVLNLTKESLELAREEALDALDPSAPGSALEGVRIQDRYDVGLIRANARYNVGRDARGRGNRRGRAALRSRSALEDTLGSIGESRADLGLSASLGDINQGEYISALVDLEKQALDARLKFHDERSTAGLGPVQLAELDRERELLEKQEELIDAGAERKRKLLEKQQIELGKSVRDIEVRTFGTDEEQRLHALDRQLEAFTKTLREAGLEGEIGRIEAAFGRMREEAKAGFVDLNSTFESGLAAMIDSALAGESQFEDIMKGMSNSIRSQFARGFADALYEKSGFDAVLQTNFLEFIPGIAAQGIGSIGTMFSGLTSALMGGSGAGIAPTISSTGAVTFAGGSLASAASGGIGALGAGLATGASGLLAASGLGGLVGGGAVSAGTAGLAGTASSNLLANFSAAQASQFAGLAASSGSGATATALAGQSGGLGIAAKSGAGLGAGVLAGIAAAGIAAINGAVQLPKSYSQQRTLANSFAGGLGGGVAALIAAGAGGNETWQRGAAAVSTFGLSELAQWAGVNEWLGIGQAPGQASRFRDMAFPMFYEAGINMNSLIGGGFYNTKNQEAPFSRIQREAMRGQLAGAPLLDSPYFTAGYERFGGPREMEWTAGLLPQAGGAGDALRAGVDPSIAARGFAAGSLGAASLLFSSENYNDTIANAVNISNVMASQNMPLEMTNSMMRQVMANQGVESGRQGIMGLATTFNRGREKGGDTLIEDYELVSAVQSFVDLYGAQLGGTSAEKLIGGARVQALGARGRGEIDGASTSMINLEKLDFLISLAEGKASRTRGAAGSMLQAGAAGSRAAGVGGLMGEISAGGQEWAAEMLYGNQDLQNALGKISETVYSGRSPENLRLTLNANLDEFDKVFEEYFEGIADASRSQKLAEKLVEERYREEIIQENARLFEESSLAGMQQGFVGGALGTAMGGGKDRDVRRGVMSNLWGTAMSGFSSGLSEDPFIKGKLESIAKLNKGIYTIGATGRGDEDSLAAYLNQIEVEMESILDYIDPWVDAWRQAGKAIQEALEVDDLLERASYSMVNALRLEGAEERRLREERERDELRSKQYEEVIRKKNIQLLGVEIEQARIFGDEVAQAEAEMERSAEIVASLASQTAEELISPQQAFQQTIERGVSEAIINGIVDGFIEGESMKGVLQPIFDKINDADLFGMTDKQFAEFSSGISGDLEGIDYVKGSSRLTQILDLVYQGDIGKSLRIKPAPTPGFAGGGIVMNPTHALLAESGPEMVIPLTGGMNGIGGTNVQVIMSGNTIMSDAEASRFADHVGGTVMRAVQRNRPMG